MDEVVSTLKMVVIVLISWESPEGMSPGHANEKLQKKIEILGELIKFLYTNLVTRAITDCKQHFKIVILSNNIGVS